MTTSLCILQRRARRQTDSSRIGFVQKRVVVPHLLKFLWRTSFWAPGVPCFFGQPAYCASSRGRLARLPRLLFRHGGIPAHAARAEGRQAELWANEPHESSSLASDSPSLGLAAALLEMLNAKGFLALSRLGEGFFSRRP